jgi:hypothetical protein
MQIIGKENQEVSIVALHEAGHSVVGAYLRVPFSRVTIKPESNSGGHVALVNYKMLSDYDRFERAVLNRAYKRLPVDAIEGNEYAIVERAMKRTFANRRRALTNRAIMILAARAVVSEYVPKKHHPEWHYGRDEEQLREIANAPLVKRGSYKAWRVSLYKQAQEIIKIPAVKLTINFTAYELDRQKTLTSKHVRDNLRFWMDGHPGLEAAA